MSDDVLIELTVKVDRSVHRTESDYVVAAERAEAVARQAVNGLLGCRVVGTHAANLPVSERPAVWGRPLRIKDEPRWMWDPDAIDDTVGEDDEPAPFPSRFGLLLETNCVSCGQPTANGWCRTCDGTPSWVLDPEADQ